MPTDNGVEIVIGATDQSGAILQAVEERLKRVAAAAQSTDRAIKNAGEHAVPAMSAASASVRALEGNFGHNTRAVERFLSTTLKLAPIMEAAFPIVGALSLLTVLSEMAIKAFEVEEAGRNAGSAIDEAFNRLAASGQLANDELRVTNDKLELAIAKLEGKPRNGLKLAIDEAIVSAEKLFARLQADNDKISEILSKNSVGSFSIGGQQSTKDVDKGFEQYKKQAEDLTFAGAERARQAKSADEAQAIRTQTQNQLLALQSQKLAQLRTQYAKDVTSRDADEKQAAPGTYDATHSSFDAKIASERGLIAAIQNQADNEHLTAQNEDLTKTKDILEANKERHKSNRDDEAKQQAFLERTAKLGIGDVHLNNGRFNVGGKGLDYSAVSREGQAGKLDDASRKEEQDAIGRVGEAYFKEKEEEGKLALEQSNKELQARREQAEAEIQLSARRRQAATSDADFLLSIGRINAQQRIAIERAAIAQELAEKQHAAAVLATLDRDDPAKLQRDKDQEVQAEQQYNDRLVQLDQQAYQARRAAAEPFLHDILNPFLDKPKSAADAFKKMADSILGDLARIAEKKITDQLLGGLLGPAPGASPIGDPGIGGKGGALTSGIGGILGKLGGLFGGGKGSAITGAASIAATDTAAKLGSGGGAGSVQIINQTSTPVAAASTQSTEDQFGNKVISVILKEAETGGSIISAIGGSLKGFLGF